MMSERFSLCLEIMKSNPMQIFWASTSDDVLKGEDWCWQY